MHEAKARHKVGLRALDGDFLADALIRILVIAGIILAFAVAGAMDCNDRTANLASMLPDQSWAGDAP